MATVVQAAPATSGASTAFTGNTTAHNTVVIGFGEFAFSNTVLSSSAPLLGGSPNPNGATLVVAEPSGFSGSGVVYFGYWVLPDVPAGLKTVSVSPGGGGTAFACWAWEVNEPAGPLIADLAGGTAKAQQANAANPDSGAVPATLAAAGIAFGAAIELSVALTTPAGFTALAGPSNFAWAGYKLLSGAGQTPDFACSSGGGSACWAAVCMALVPQAASTATGTISISGSGGARAVAAAAGSLSVAATAVAAAPGAAAGAVTLTGAATARAPGSAAGALAVSGTAAVTAPVTAAGQVVFSGTASAGQPGSTASASLALAGTAAAQAPATPAGSAALSGTATAQAPATAAGTITLAGTAAAAGPAPAVRNATSSPAVTTQNTSAARVTGNASGAAVTARATSVPAVSDG